MLRKYSNIPCTEPQIPTITRSDQTQVVVKTRSTFANLLAVQVIVNVTYASNGGVFDATRVELVFETRFGGEAVEVIDIYLALRINTTCIGNVQSVGKTNKHHTVAGTIQAIGNDAELGAGADFPIQIERRHPDVRGVIVACTGSLPWIVVKQTIRKWTRDLVVVVGVGDFRLEGQIW